MVGAERLGVLGDTTPAIDNIMQLLLPGLRECVEVVGEEYAPIDSADLNAQVARLRESEPDAILVASVGGSFEVLAHNTIVQQLPSLLRVSLASIGNQPDSWELANPGALEGLVYMGSLSTENSKTEELRQFLDETREANYEITAYDAQAYDTVQLIKRAIEDAGGTDDPDAIRDAMDSITDFEASFGQPGFTLSFDRDKHIGADGLCGLVLTEFGPDNAPVGPWETYQAPC